MSALLEVVDLVVEYRHRHGVVRALDGVSLEVAAGETVGLVGESGSGKSTLGRAVLGLTPARSGCVSFDGEQVTSADRTARRRLSASMQVVFQDPYSSLNPTRTIGQTLAQPLRVHRRLAGGEAEAAVRSMLQRVGMPAEAARRYPMSFSGGQRQRIAIARALMISPRLVICDEPLSALDLSIQAQIVNLLVALRGELGLSYLFIAHDLPVVRYLADRVVVLYRGQVMESGPARDLHDHPVHPYTRALVEAIPSPDPSSPRPRQRAERAADAPPASGAGCPFAPRCPFAVERCAAERPAESERAGGGIVYCHRHDALDPVAPRSSS